MAYSSVEVFWKAKQIQRLLDGISPYTICDVGCGSGEILHQLSVLLGQDRTYVGYDISPKLLTHWNIYAGDNVSYRCDDFLSTQDNYDLLYMTDVLEHIENHMGFLKEIKNRAEYKIFGIPLEISALKVLLDNRFSISYQRYGHINFFSKEIALTILNGCGYEIIDYILAPSSIEMAGKIPYVSKSSAMLKIPRILLSKISVDFTQKLLGGYALYVLAK